MTEYYGFTIKCIKHNHCVEISELENIMYDMLSCHKGLYVQHYYEHDSLDRLHIHGTFMARKGLLKSRFKKQYWHIHIDHLKTTDDVENWTKYIHKEQFTTLIEDRDNGEYLFI